MDKSLFTDKKITPTDDDLKKALGETFALWQLIVEFVHLCYANALDDWNYPGEKYGWSFRIKDKKRAIVYLLPRENCFKVAMVFGQKATDKIMESDIFESIKTELAAARVYAEGRGIRIEITNENQLEDIKKMIDIKLRN